MTTPNLQIPELAHAQANPEVTVNQALRRIDALLSFGVLTLETLTAPPGSPAEGDMHVIGDPATGEWAGAEANIVYRSSSAWHFVPPQEGMMVWHDDSSGLYVYTLGAWTQMATVELVTTPQFGWTEMQAGGGQPHLTLNETLREIDAMLNGAVNSFNAFSEPNFDVEVYGTRHIISGSPDGEWAGKPYWIATWRLGRWYYTEPKPGMLVWLIDDQTLAVYRNDDTWWFLDLVP